MSEVLALFCGGPAIYDAGVPKPLRRVGSATLLEQYLRHGLTRPADSVVLLCDEEHSPVFAEIAARVGPAIAIRANSAASSTFDSARSFLAAEVLDPETIVHFAYPDVFAWEPIVIPESADLSSRILLTITSLKSRFPRLVIDPYTFGIRGISTHTSRVPANPIHVFGGDILGQAALLTRLIDEFAAANGDPSLQLESDFFAWTINRSVADSLPLFGDWQQVDSPRDVQILERRLRERAES